MRILVSGLMRKLRDENSISYSTVEKYAGLREGALEGYLMWGEELPPKKERKLISALFLLDNTLNRENPFPWEGY